jgi:hypothetical protein
MHFVILYIFISPFLVHGIKKFSFITSYLLVKNHGMTAVAVSSVIASHLIIPLARHALLLIPFVSVMLGPGNTP